MKNAWDQWLEEFQFELDVLGLIPGIGEYADLANGVIYTLQGDGFNATLSFASTIPVYGWFTTNAKWASKVVTGASGRSIRLKLIKDGNQVVFSYRGQLAKVITVPPGKHAHHIIPWNKRTDVLVQHAAKGDNLHMNDFNNGIAIENWRNQPNHPIYDNQVQNSLNQIKTNLENQYGTSLENISPNAVASELKVFQDYLKALISNNPNKHLNELSINYP